MAYNRKMRKFEGTCYIPGEQLAMMAKYYRGANLNLNLTLYEDDLATMQETLDQACWCSKLDEVDRMKMAHMKGNEWRIAHDHCLVGDQHGHDGRNPKVYPALPQMSRSAVDKVERGTSTLSLYDRERGLVRGGRYQRDNYSEHPCWRDDCYDPRNLRDDHYNLRTRPDDLYDRRNRRNEYSELRDDYSESYYRRDDYYDRQNRREQYNDPRFRKNYYSDPRNFREDNEMNYRRDDYPGQPIYHAQVAHNGKRAGRLTPDRRHEMESEAAMSSLPEVPEIRCAVCNLETCLICKNHLYTPMCQCKCPIANAGLCKTCSQEPCEGEEEEQVSQVTRGNKMDISSMMLKMMMSSMLKQSQVPESVCCCKPSKDDSETSSSDPSTEKVHTVYLYDCQGTQKKMACECCKCSKKSKKNSGTEDKSRRDSSSEETSENESGQKRRSSKKKSGKDSKKKPKKGGANSNSDSDRNPQAGKEINEKSTDVKHRSNKNSKGDDIKSIKLNKDENFDENMESMRANKGINGGFKAQGDTDTTSIPLSSAENSSLTKSQGLSIPKSDCPKVTWRYERSPQMTLPRTSVHISEKHDTQLNITDLGSPTKDGDDGGFGEESNTIISLREFIVCLPKIQSNLQSLMYKLNQMDVLNNEMQYSQLDPSLTNTQLFRGEMQARHDVPLLSPPQNSLHDSPGSSYKQNTQLQKNKHQKPDSEISIGYSAGNIPVQNLLPTISPGSSKDESKVHEPLSGPTRYHSVVNFSNLGGNLESNKSTADQKKQVPQFHELAESIKTIQPPFKFSPLAGGSKAKNLIENQGGNHWSFKNGSHPAHSPSMFFPVTDQDLVLQHHLKSGPTTGELYCETEPGKIHCYQPGSSVTGNGLEPLSNVFPLTGSHNVEITELPETTVCNQGNNTPRKSNHNVQNVCTAAEMLSRNDRATGFHSCKQESSATSNQELTDYASFTDERCFKPSPASSVQQAIYNKRNEINSTIEVNDCRSEGKRFQKHDDPNHTQISTKNSQNQSEKRASRMAKSGLKVHKGAVFKAKQRSLLSLEKLVQGCNLRGGKVAGPIRNASMMAAAFIRKPKMKLQDKGVGPGIFRRSNSDSSLDLLKGITVKQNEIKSSNQPKTSRAPERRKEKEGKNSSCIVTPKHAGKNCGVIPLQNKRSASPIKEKARYTVSMNDHNISPEMKMSTPAGKASAQNIPSDLTSDQTNSKLKMTNEDNSQRIGSQSNIASSVEVKTIDNHGSTTDVFKMVHRIASSSQINMTDDSSVPPYTGPVRSEDLDVIPLIPLSSTTTSDGPESRIENHPGATIKKQLFLDDEISSHTPTFLRKSRVQVEQLKRAHETIHSMIKNVKEVIAHIDSDSKIGIKSKLRSEDKERLSYFVHFGDDEKKRQGRCDSQDRANGTSHFEKQAKTGRSCELAHSSDIQNREVQEMFLHVERVINSVLTPSDQSSDNQGPGWPSETPVITTAQRDFFVLNSESSANAFTETLRRALENETSSSIPLATQRPLFQDWGQQRQRSTR